MPDLVFRFSETLSISLIQIRVLQGCSQKLMDRQITSGDRLQISKELVKDVKTCSIAFITLIPSSSCGCWSCFCSQRSCSCSCCNSFAASVAIPAAGRDASESSGTIAEVGGAILVASEALSVAGGPATDTGGAVPVVSMEQVDVFLAGRAVPVPVEALPAAGVVKPAAGRAVSATSEAVPKDGGALQVSQWSCLCVVGEAVPVAGGTLPVTGGAAPLADCSFVQLSK